MHSPFTYIFFGLLTIIFVVLYSRNAYKLYIDVKQENYGLLTIARGAGIFFPLLGAVLGLV